MSDIPGRAAHAAAMAGDDYQHLITWNEVLYALLGENGVETVTVEDPDGASVDDVVIRYADGRIRYLQAKHAVDAATPVGSDWLMVRKGNGRSVLKKFYDSWDTLGGRDGHIEMELVTDRQIDQDDPVMRCFDASTERLTPLVGTAKPTKALAKQRNEWAEHAEVAVEDLIAMLQDLRFRTGRPEAAEMERATLLMQLNGLAGDRTALDSAIALVREWIRERWRELAVDDLQRRTNERIQRRTDPWSLLVVEGIDDVSYVDAADVAVRFVEEYEETDPYYRRQLREPDRWQAVYGALVDAADRLRDSERTRVLVRGAMRLPMGFATGAALRHVRGFTVGAAQGSDVWASDSAGSSEALEPAIVKIEQGDDLAIAIAVANDVTDAVHGYIMREGLPVKRLVTLTPQVGAGNEALQSGSEAATLALSMRDAARRAFDLSGARRIHLFLSAPVAFTVLLGHRWNALGATIVYEHLVSSNYVPAMTVPS